MRGRTTDVRRMRRIAPEMREKLLSSSVIKEHHVHFRRTVDTDHQIQLNVRCFAGAGDHVDA
jgi:hypothetical protein